MPIQSGDIKLLKSAVMADVPEGGGAPTGIAIADGVSNAIFPDVSELDRAGGRVNLRKAFVAVQTSDTDTYFGGNVIVAEPPEDPRVSVTLFSNRNTFDTRQQAQSRIEAYLNRGPEWGGYLFENHIQGQRVVQLFQRVGAEVPNVGQTLVLVENENLGTQKEQYVRATAVSVVERTFTYDGDKDYQANIVTVELSDALRTDFTGSPASRTFTRATNGTRVRDTVVADAGTYVGVVPLTQPAAVGAFTINGQSVFTQLVPSAQTETPIADVRTNGLSAALVATGGAVTQTISMGFTTSTRMYVGGPIYPGSLSIVRDGVTATDNGGILVSSAAPVGTVDYDNGIVTLATNLWGSGGGSHTVTFVPAAVPDLISEQLAIRVTPESRSLNYTFVLQDIPVRRTLNLSYLAQGRWYVLRDDGSGRLAGTSSENGVGTLSYATGSVSATLGALPDVGSSIVVQYYSEVTTVRASNTLLTNGGRVYVPINSDGALSEEAGSKSFARSSVVVTWDDGGTKTATESGNGVLTGDATGTVEYARGVLRISPNVLPPPGTVFTVVTDVADNVVATGVTLANGNLGATGIKPGSISASLLVKTNYASGSWDYEADYRATFQVRESQMRLTDDGAGNLLLDGTPGCGTINYATGAFSITPSAISSGSDAAGPAVRVRPFNTLLPSYNITFDQAVARGVISAVRTRALANANGNITYSNTPNAANSVNAIVTQFIARTIMVPNYTLKGVGFSLGATRYAQLTDGTLLKDISPTTGGGTPAGNVASALGAVFLSDWPAGASSALVNWRGLIAPPSVGTQAPFTAFSTVFRTASSPLRPASLSVLGTMQDGTAFNVTAGVDGKIDGTRVKGRVNYQYGLVELYFVNPAGDPALNVDLSALQIAGLTSTPADLAMLSTLRYSAVAFSYLPLNAELLGIDPVRLPSDGRVPIFRPGGFAVVGNTGRITTSVSNGQTINCARVRLSRVRVVGADGAVINTGYTPDLELGTVTFTNVSGYSQPVTIEHRVEDMAVVRDVQINGEISFTRALTHDYPAADSYVSSALIAGDLFARTSAVFDQSTWTGVWADAAIGSPANATFNATTYPITVTNRGALTERWLVRFTGATAFEVSGENVGVIATGNTATDCAPLNPANGAPYFTIPALGWGGGWSVGNALRFNTVGAQFPVWVVRTVQQGPETVADDSFTLLVRGDVDTP
jgi:hypothetical protein